MAAEIDDLLQDVGSCGRFQFLFVAIVYSSTVVQVWSMMFMVFGAVEPNWWCLDSYMNINTSTTLYNQITSKSLLVGDVDSNKDSSDIISQLVVLDNFTLKQCGRINETETFCQRIMFEPGVRTVVSEFQLVCDLAWVPGMIFAVQMIGVLMGALVAGQMADTTGRKITLILMVVLLSVLNMTSAFSVNWKMFAVLRTFTGFTIGGIVACSFGFAAEFVGIKCRATLGSIPVWGTSVFIFSILVWLIRDWQYLLILSSVIGAATVPTWIMVPESLRWLTVKGKVEKAHRVLQTVARWNRRKAPDIKNLEYIYQSTKKSTKNYTYFHIFSQWFIAQTSLILGLTWFALAMTYYGISFGIKDLTGDFYLTFIIMSAVEIPTSFCLQVLNNGIGRRRTCFIGLLLIALCMFSIVTVLRVAPSNAGQYVTGLCIAAKLSITIAWGSTTMFTTELYPTVVRSIGLGYCNTIARFGGIVAPYIYAFKGDRLYISYLIIGMIMTMAALTTLLHRETRGRPLQDDLKDWRKKEKQTEIDIIVAENIEECEFSPTLK